MLSGIGTIFFDIAIMWHVMKITNSATLMGVVGIMAFMGKVAFGIVGGTLSDIFNRKKLLLISDFSSASLLFLILLIFYRDIPNMLPYIFFLVFTLNLISSLYIPTVGAIVPALFKEDDLPYVYSFGSLTKNLIGIGSPALAGILIGLLSIDKFFIINAGSFLFSGLLVSMIHLPSVQNAEEKNSTDKNFLQHTKDGFIFLIHYKTILILIATLSLVNFLVVPFSVILPLLSDHVYNAGSGGYGILQSSIAVGMLIGAMVAPVTYKYTKSIFRKSFIPGYFIGASVLILGFVNRFYIGVVILLLIGLCADIISNNVTTYLAQEIPNKLLGRCSGIINTVLTVVTPLSLSLFGFLIERYSVLRIIKGMGLGLFLVLLIGVLFIVAIKDSVSSDINPAS